MAVPLGAAPVAVAVRADEGTAVLRASTALFTSRPAATVLVLVPVLSTTRRIHHGVCSSRALGKGDSGGAGRTGNSRGRYLVLARNALGVVVVLNLAGVARNAAGGSREALTTALTVGSNRATCGAR